MAFRRRTSRKTYRRRRVGKSLSRKVARVTSTVRKITHQVLEKKVVDTTVAMTTIYTPDSAVISGAYRVLPFNISQGDSISQRQGQKILAKYIKMCSHSSMRTPSQPIHAIAFALWSLWTRCRSHLVVQSQLMAI